MIGVSDFVATKPFEITPAVVTSNIPETPPAAYNAGTSYAVDTLVSVLSGVNNTTASVYRSRVNGNTGNTPGSSPTQWAFKGTLYADWNSGTAYLLHARVNRSHKLWDATQPGTNKEPGTTAGADYWVEVIGGSEPYKMFSESPGIKTVWSEEIDVTIAAEGPINSVGLVAVNAAYATVTMTEDGDELYTRTVSLVDNSGISNWFDYFFEPIRYLSDFPFYDLPLGFDPDINVKLTGGTVSIGKLVVGRHKVLGVTLYPAGLSGNDFSTVDQDEYGSAPYVTKRRASKRNRYLIKVEEADASFTYDFLTDVLGTPLMTTASINIPASTAYGLLREWNVELEGANNSRVSLVQWGF